MLPTVLTGTYKKYKKDTDDIATWLVMTAESLGYESDVQKEQPKHKGKHKQKTKQLPRRIPSDQRKHILPVKEFLSLAA